MTNDKTNQPVAETSRETLAKVEPVPSVAVACVSVMRRFPAWLLAAVLVVVTLALYWPVMHGDFVSYDDPDYVTANPRVQAGLTLSNVTWAFTTGAAMNWHPVTWLSLMLDVNLFGQNAAGFHFTNVALHAVDTVLLFWLLLRLTGAQWRSAMVAALFAWHPVHVESVAWIAERKDVLSAGFGFLALLFYVEQFKVQGRRSKVFYAASLLVFALGLLSKPMLVTWPFVLLLLDYWPLGRFQPGGVWPLVRQKIPFFTLALAVSVATFVVQKQGGAVAAAQSLPLDMRCGNAVISYGRYLGKLFWPADLAVIYPYPGYLLVKQVLLAGVCLIGLSVLLFLLRRRHPFLLMGWLWYCGTLVPVIGLVQVGSQAMADRYAYLPSVGIFVIAIWGAAELTRCWRCQELVLSVTGLAVVTFCLALTRQQLGYWQDSETLFRHALEVTKNNYIAHRYLGEALDRRGQTAAAVWQFQQAIRFKPNFSEAHDDLGAVLTKQGRTNEAISEFQIALQLKPDFAEAHDNLGIMLVKQGQTNAAISHFQEALRFKPDYAEAHDNLGILFSQQGETDAAIAEFQAALRLKPDNAEAHYDLASLLARQGRTDEAITQYQAALRLNPDDYETHYNLGILLAQQGQMPAAVIQFQETLRLQPDCAEAHCNLGHLLLQQGRIDGAISEFQAAIRCKPDYALACNSLGIAYGSQGRLDEAISEFQAALRVKPDYASAQNNLTKALALKHKTNLPSSEPAKP